MRFIFIICFLYTIAGVAQNDAIAKDYYSKGEFEKALVEYKRLYAQSPSNINYINKIVSTHQQLEQYDDAETFLLKIMERINYPAFFVELGYNFQLKNDLDKANSYYNKALASIEENPNHVFGIARMFQSHTLLDQAIEAYNKATLIKPEFNFDLQLAQLYGEQGNVEKMFTSYIDFIAANPIALTNIKRAINDFITEDSTNENNILFRKILLKNIQEEPNLLWNKLLSWLFIQQRDFKKAFAQEKAIFNREAESLSGLEQLAHIALNDGQDTIALEVFTFIINTAQDIDTQLRAHRNIMLIKTKLANKEDYKTINEQYLNIFEQYGKLPQTLDIQISYAHFLAFNMDSPEQATQFLEMALELPLAPLQKAQVKLELGDILLLQEKFNKALIYFSQIQRNLKNSTISQEARFKVAKASYYKGDFKWAEAQLKILKSSTSQLIANDALDLKLLISDNKYEDSTQTALKLYAKADLLAFQNKNEAAIALLDKILKEHKTEPIVAQALYKQGQLFEGQLQFEKAMTNYELVVANYRDGILIDDALYRLANIYIKQFNDKEKAKALLEQIIFNHADSIYFVEARKLYRSLRGDVIN
ncbi:tetratricopeptide repeat protein [Aestuariivivens insulae]|uniref:tetratricopeptide repeat protein n=1 Tax=Aestuariivivens insulae TaxID=1621988 RepID=UPI001F567AD1|nr:tetratricopeptide repeat protein [Aestuariivivens insulae]